MGFVWDLRGICAGVAQIFVGFAWDSCGSCVGIAWDLCGIRVEFAWDLRGICVGFVLGFVWIDCCPDFRRRQLWKDFGPTFPSGEELKTAFYPIRIFHIAFLAVKIIRKVEPPHTIEFRIFAHIEMALQLLKRVRKVDRT